MKIQTTTEPRRINRVWRMFYAIVGLLALGLAILGIVLPLLPTTPFLLLAAICFARSSASMYNWLHTNKVFGAELSSYRNREGIPLRLKIYTLVLLWTTILGSILFFVPTTHLWIKLLLLTIAIGVTIHVLAIKTYSATP